MPIVWRHLSVYERYIRECSYFLLILLAPNGSSALSILFWSTIYIIIVYNLKTHWLMCISMKKAGQLIWLANRCTCDVNCWIFLVPCKRENAKVFTFLRVGNYQMGATQSKASEPVIFYNQSSPIQVQSILIFWS